MFNRYKTAQERWGGVNDTLDKWLQDRKELLVQYWRLSEIAEEASDEVCAPAVQRLCQIMVDYTSAGHFEVYDQLIREGQEFDDKAGLASAGELFKLIDTSTEQILDFNDKYQETDDLDSIVPDLSRLGEALAHRFEAEDAMIEVLHMAHKDKVLP